MLHKEKQKVSGETLKKRKRIFKNTIRLLFLHNMSLLFGQGILIGISILLLTPFLSGIFRTALSITGYSYLTVNNIGLFLLNPLVLLLMICLFIIIGIFLLWEACYLITFYTVIENGEKPRQLKIFLLSLKKLLLIFIRRNFTLLPMVWLITALSNLPLFIFISKRVRLISFITETVFDNPFALPVTVIITILLLWVMLRRLFIFLYSVIEGKTYVKARKETGVTELNDEAKEKGPGILKRKNIKTKSGFWNTAVINSDYIKRINTFRTFIYFIFWNLGIGLLVLGLYIVTMAITTLFIAGIPDKSLAIATFLTVNDNMNGYLFIGIFAVGTIANFALYTHLFYQYKLEFKEDISPDRAVDNIVIKVGAYRNVIKISIVLLAFANFYSFYDIIRNGSPLDYMNLDLIRVTSHRGFSGEVPENTLPAIEKALEEQADSIEVDVRMTKDGELVLLHDDNLRRTTGVNKKIWEMDYTEVSALDAGSWKNKIYTGTKIPTLREVLELCKGRVNLNLELKYRSASEGLEEKVVALIDEYDMEWQCVISSTSLTALYKIKELKPDIRTGFIAYQIFRGYYDNEYIDFFSIRSNLVTKALCREIHKSGKEIHVWTVNTKNELERMKRLGVDYIITDDPSYAKEVLYQADSDRFLLTLLKIIME